MNLQNFATIPAIRSTQFGREIFSGMLRFKDLRNFLRVFPEVQRSCNGRKVNSIKRYVLSWLDNPEEEMRFFSALTATTRGEVFYDETTKKVAIDINFSKLSVNDGQHRTYAVSEALDELKMKESTAKKEEDAAAYRAKRETLENMSIVIVIFNQMTEQTEAQLFSDINNLSSRPSRNANIRLTQNEPWARLAMKLSQEHPNLLELGVEMNKNAIFGSNPNFILLSTVHAVCKNLFYRELKADRDFLTAHNFDDVYEDISNHWTRIFEALPQPLNIKGKYMLRRSFAFRGLATYIREAYEDITIDKEDIYKAISNVNWLDSVEAWKAYGATASKENFVSFPNNGGSGEPAVRAACFAELNRIIGK